LERGQISGHRGFVTDVLKRRMNFGGFVIIDWHAHGEVAGCTDERCAQAINTGIDIVMRPSDSPERTSAFGSSGDQLNDRSWGAK
jgi:beta-glucosidase-like glycosyl hydrolase